MNNQSIAIVGTGKESIYGKVPVGSFLSSIYKIKKHVLANDPIKLDDFNVKEAVTVLNIDEINVKSIREIPVAGIAAQVIINEDENLIFPKDRTFVTKLTDKVECDKTILGDERTALYACKLINEENQAALEKHIMELMEASQSMKSTIDRQEARIKELDRVVNQ